MKLKPRRRAYYLRYIKRAERRSRRIALDAARCGHWTRDGFWAVPVDFSGAEYNYLVHIMRERLACTI